MHPGRLSANVVAIGSNNATEVLLIPKCIVKISTPGSIDLGQAYSVGNLPLPAPRPFTLYADFDESCDGGFRIVDLGNLVIPLKIMFQPENNLELTPLNNGIVLKNQDNQSNGLALNIKQGAVPIGFNQWYYPSTSLTTTVRPVPLYYTAELTKTGMPLIPGSFSQQVTVLITFQ